MTEFVIGTAADREEIIDFINYVFSQAHRPHDFKKMMPKSYADDAIDLGAVHYLAKKDGKIKAVIAQRIMDVNCGGNRLKLGLIGNVSVHPYSRGEGYMKQLMAMAIRDAKTRGVDMMALGGQRQRYAYFGFENAGANLRFSVTKENIRHCFGDLDVSDISFRDFDEATEPELREAIALYESRPYYGVRPWVEYRNIMRTWQRSSRLILRQGGIIGYSSGDELVLRQEADLGPVLKALFAADGLGEMKLTVMPWQTERAAFLSRICEGSSIAEQEQIRVLNWQRVLQTLLSFKAAYTALQDGTVALAIDGQSLQITVAGGKPLVEACEATENAIPMTQNEALLRLFGLNSLLLPEEIFKNWAPLPFMIDGPDTY